MSDALQRQFDAWSPTQRQGIINGLSGSGLARLLQGLDWSRQRLLAEAADRKGLFRLQALHALPEELRELCNRRLGEMLMPAPAVMLTRDKRIDTAAERARLELPLAVPGDRTELPRLGVQSEGRRSPNGIQGSLRQLGRIEEQAEQDNPVAEELADRYAMRHGQRHA